MCYAGAPEKYRIRGKRNFMFISPEGRRNFGNLVCDGERVKKTLLQLDPPIPLSEIPSTCPGMFFNLEPLRAHAEPAIEPSRAAQSRIEP